MKRIFVGLWLYFFLIAVPGARSEQLQTFNWGTQGNPTFTTPHRDIYYTFSADSYQIIDSPGLCGCASNGTPYFATSATMTMTDGGLLTLLNFDAAQLYSPGDPRNATAIVLAPKACFGSCAPTTATMSFTLPTDGSFATFIVPLTFHPSNSNQYTLVEFYGIGPGAANTSFAIDNIHTVASPEPASIPLILSGLGGLAFVARRKKRHSSPATRVGIAVRPGTRS